MSSHRSHQSEAPRADAERRLSGEKSHPQARLPVAVGTCFAVLAIVLTLMGLWREDNLSFRNVALGIVLCGGTWGLVSWAITTAVVQVEEEVASGRHNDADHQ